MAGCGSCGGGGASSHRPRPPSADDRPLTDEEIKAIKGDSEPTSAQMPPTGGQ